MEGLKLNVTTTFPQHVHHQFQVLGVADVPRHRGEVMSVQEQFSQ